MSSLSLLDSQLLGYSDDHVVALPGHMGIYIHHEVVSPLQQLIGDAKQAGFQLQVASGFRHFERQLLIWNNKCSGKRAILDDRGNEINVSALTAIEKVYAILRWSALPGASRHHWGTDIDIYDVAAMPPDYQLQLHPDEYVGAGLFAPMMTWLDNYLQQKNTPDFYRPYLQDNGGVSPELWHLSYRPVASRYVQQFSVSLLRDYLAVLVSAGKKSNAVLEEQEAVLDYLPTIYQRFICL
jgi:LAS superfamily LD-carboxypeptidase LdcB